MFELYSCNLIAGVVFGVQYEKVEGDDYLIVSLGVFELIFIW
jgi:hypothetical protein